MLQPQFAQYTTDAQRRSRSHNVIETSKPTVVSDLASEPGRCRLAAACKFTVFADSPSAFDARALNEEAASLGSVGGVALAPEAPAGSTRSMWSTTPRVALLAERLGVKLEDCIAMGDGANDATMLRTVA